MIWELFSLVVTAEMLYERISIGSRNSCMGGIKGCSPPTICARIDRPVIVDLMSYRLTSKFTHKETLQRTVNCFERSALLDENGHFSFRGLRNIRCSPFIGLIGS